MQAQEESLSGCPCLYCPGHHSSIVSRLPLRVYSLLIPLTAQETICPTLAPLHPALPTRHSLPASFTTFKATPQPCTEAPLSLLRKSWLLSHFSHVRLCATP